MLSVAFLLCLVFWWTWSGPGPWSTLSLILNKPLGKSVIQVCGQGERTWCHPLLLLWLRPACLVRGAPAHSRSSLLWGLVGPSTGFVSCQWRRRTFGPGPGQVLGLCQPGSSSCLCACVCVQDPASMQKGQSCLGGSGGERQQSAGSGSKPRLQGPECGAGGKARAPEPPAECSTSKAPLFLPA